jgi:hypothetical protein
MVAGTVPFGWGGAMKRWMAGAAAALAAVTGLAAAGPAQASTAWYQTFQVNRRGSFDGIAAISPTNIWAVGDLWGKKGNTIYQPFIRHYDGSWGAVPIPGAPKFSTDQVTASAANDVWVFGLRPGSVAQSVAYRYDGSRWHRIPVPALTYLQGAVALGPSNVWAFGSSGTIFAPGEDVSASVFHWNGTKWRGYGPDGGALVPESISASAGNNVWIAGAVRAGPAERAVAYRWNGTSWRNAGLPRVLNDDPGVSALSPGNAWIGWATETKSYALHWDGQHWHTVTVPDNVYANTSNVVPDGRGGYWFGFAAILTGSTWTSEPIIENTGGFGDVFRIPGTESFLMPASVETQGSTIQRPTLYRFDL